MKHFKSLIGPFFAAALAVLTLFSAVSCSQNPDLGWRQSDCSAYVTPGQYKGLVYTQRIPAPVTDSDVDSYVRKVLEENSSVETVTTGNFMPGDEVRMDFEGKSGETTEIKFSGYITVLGTKGFFDDFVGGLSALYDMPVSPTVELKLTYRPDAAESKAGRTLDFTLSVAGVKRYHNAVLDDAFVKEHGGFENVDAYLAFVRSSLEASRREECASQESDELWRQVVRASTVVSYPNGAVGEYEAFFKEYFLNSSAKAGLSPEDYSRLFFGVDKTDSAANAELLVKQDLVLYRIAAIEGFSVSADEYSAYASETAREKQISVEQLEAQFTQVQIKKSILFSKVLRLIKDSASPVAAPSENVPSDDLTQPVTSEQVLTSEQPLTSEQVQTAQ
ncbi:MAG: hypothetical protein IJV00_01115 [Clostridia bacterium]|nr:hypothetical protein [Clostridia bacterium]